jgi:hypothetical protein
MKLPVAGFQLPVAGFQLVGQVAPTALPDNEARLSGDIHSLFGVCPLPFALCPSPLRYSLFVIHYSSFRTFASRTRSRTTHTACRLSVAGCQLPGDTHSLFGVCAHFVSSLFVIRYSAFALCPSPLASRLSPLASRTRPLPLAGESPFCPSHRQIKMKNSKRAGSVDKCRFLDDSTNNGTIQVY